MRKPMRKPMIRYYARLQPVKYLKATTIPTGVAKQLSLLKNFKSGSLPCTLGFYKINYLSCISSNYIHKDKHEP